MDSAVDRTHPCIHFPYLLIPELRALGVCRSTTLCSCHRVKAGWLPRLIDHRAVDLIFLIDYLTYHLTP